MPALSFEIFLSDKIRAALPSLTAVSHSTFISSILSLSEEPTSNVQSIMLIFLENIFNNHSENITITKDKNLELDPYFYERQKELHQIKNDIDNGKIQMIENDDFWSDIDNFVETLQK